MSFNFGNISAENPLVRNKVHFDLPGLQARLHIDYQPKCLMKVDDRNFDLLRMVVRQAMHERKMSKATDKATADAVAPEAVAPEAAAPLKAPPSYAVARDLDKLAHRYALKYMRFRYPLTVAAMTEKAKEAWARTFATLERTAMEAWIMEYVVTLM